MTDVDSGESVSIPTDDISEPMFHQGRGGLRHRVHPGNDHFIQNDRIERPQGGGGGGSGSGQGQASQDGEGQDEFVFQISKDEYLDLLFEDLALPNLKKTSIASLTSIKLTAPVSPQTACRPISAWYVRYKTLWRAVQQ